MYSQVLIIVGAGGFGREVYQWALDQIEVGKARFSKIQFIDDSLDELSFPEVSDNFRGTVSDYIPGLNELAVVAIGNSEIRRTVTENLRRKGAQFGSVIHPSSNIARNAVHNEGLILCPNSCLSANTKIGAHVHINFGSSVGHDSILGDFVTVSSHADIMGNCVLGDDVFLGSGARVLPKCKVASGTRVGAGATVQRSIRQKSVLYHVATKRM